MSGDTSTVKPYGFANDISEQVGGQVVRTANYSSED